MATAPARVPSGLLLVNKPSGVTSHDAVQVVRRKLGLRRIGHTGTLDPMAEGLLVLLVGPSTKFQRDFQSHDKTYQAVIRLGTQTDTGDRDGSPVKTAAVPPLTPEQVARVLASLEGMQSQVPPSYSAVKVHGRPAYWWARRKQPVVLAARTVRLASLTLVACEAGAITVRVDCSAGTYIRTLAELVAERLGTVGHVGELVRLRVGRWTLEEAKSLAWLREAAPEAVAGALQPVTVAPRAAPPVSAG